MIEGVPGPNQSTTGVPRCDRPTRTEYERARDEMRGEGVNIAKLTGFAVMVFIIVAGAAALYAAYRVINWVLP